MSFPRFFSMLVAVPACLALGCAAPPASEGPPMSEPAPEERAESFAPLFDGESFEGWEGNLDFFRIEDGAVVGGRLDDEIPRNEFLCTTEEYSDFELRLQARTSREDANGGIQIRSHRIPNESEVVGYQADIGLLGGETPINIWGALYDEARRREMLAVADQDELAKVVRLNDWNDYVIRAQGKHTGIWINGYQTVDYTEADPDIELTGIICLQLHAGPPAEIRYRNLEIRKPGGSGS